MTPEGILLLVAPPLEKVLEVAASAGAGAMRSPCVYVIHATREEMVRTFEALARQGLAGEATLFHGSLCDFLRDIPVTPDWLWLGPGAGFNAAVASSVLPPGIPIIAPDRSQLDSAIAAGVVEAFNGAFRTTARCRGTASRPDTASRIILQGSLHESYFVTGAKATAEVTLPLRASGEARGSSGRAPWPYTAKNAAELPPTLPSGRPWPKISIVTPSFNQGAYIEETILSVLHQEYPRVEHIVMDGGSTDGTAAVLDRYRARLAHVSSEPDNGQSHAINKGMALATGDIVTWLNSDDMFAPGALAAMAIAFDTHPADMIAGICRLYRDGVLEAQHITSCADGPLPLHDLLDLDHGWNAGQFFYQPEVMFTREMWLRAGGYVNDWLHYSMDYELWLRFAQAGARLHVIGRPIAWFRLHEQQKTHVTARFQAELKICRQDFLTKSGVESRPVAPPKAPRSHLRITMVNDIGAFYGAGIAHARMARALAWAGHDVSLIAILDRSLVGLESTHYTTEDVLSRVEESNPDLVIAGNLHAANADPFLLQLLAERFPTAAVAHDFWSITGRCAYPGACEKYLGGCDESCPTPGEYPPLDPSRIADAWSKKRVILAEPRGPALLANSAWTADLLRHAFASENCAPAIEQVRLSFPLDVFRPRDRAMCREMLGLPSDRFIVLLPGSLTDPRKGGPAFLQALAAVHLPNLLVVALGRTDPNVDFGLEVRQLGQIHDSLKVAMLNSAADVLVIASTEETFGQAAVEAIACGTPAVGFAASGIRDAIRNGVTGVFATETNPVSLAASVQFLYTHPSARADLARWGRLYVENEWSEFAASRSLYLAFRSIDRDGRLNLGRNVRFLGSPPPFPAFQIIAQCEQDWRPVQGFSGLEYPQPENRLPQYRWTYGPGAIAEVFASTDGLNRLLISYRNPHDGQRIRLRANGSGWSSFDLPNTGFGTGRMLVANIELARGANLLQLEFARWNTTGERPTAIIVTDIIVEPVAGADEIARQTTAREMLSGVWGTGRQPE